VGGKLWTEEELAELWQLTAEEFAKKHPERTLDSIGAQRRRRSRQARVIGGSEATVPLTEQVRKALAGGALTIEALADAVDRSPRAVQEAVDELRRQHYEVNLRDGEVVLDRQYRASDLVLDLTGYYRDALRVGIISCTHFGNRYRQLAALTTFYRVCEKEGVHVVIMSGDLTDGLGMYKGQEFDQYAHGADEQVEVAVAEYPQSHITTMVIGGNHDYSFQRRSGTNVVRRICGRRADLTYCGMLAANFLVGDQVRVRVMHARGGVPYARSYRGQKSNEAMGRGDNVPQVFCIGGLHVVDYVPYLNVHTFLAGCFQGQTPYLQEKGLFPDIGGWIATMNLGDDGSLNRCLLEWVAFEERREFAEGPAGGSGGGGAAGA